MRNRLSLDVKLLVAVLAVSMLAACDSQVFDHLGKTVEDPVIAYPSVVSLEVENTISISWAADSAADVFVLERSPDSAVLDYQEIYSGTELVYTDAALPDDSRFLYRLTNRVLTNHGAL